MNFQISKTDFFMNILSKNLFSKCILTPDRLKMLHWRELNGCPDIVNAAYDGYTGAKFHNFPTGKSFRLCAYPDVTKDFNRLKHILVKDIKKTKSEVFGSFKVLKMFLENFATGEKWDTKFLPEFPGRDRSGRVQFAKYNGKIVAGNYLSNHIYGFLCAAAGIPEKLSKFVARIYSKGFIEPLISGEIPNKTLLKFKDPISDQEAISAGYKEFRELK